MSNYLHIVCLDAPAPPSYGGAIDIYYKVKALAKTGRQIILHYFDYHKNRSGDGLEKYCVAIHAYHRKSFLKALPISQPFIVQSRINDALIDRLNRDEHPVLLEGLHCSGIIPFLNNKNRALIRMHNDEAAYYHHLANTEGSFWKKQYFIRETKLLKQYQQQLDKNIQLACLSEKDLQTFKNAGFHKVQFIPCFLPWQTINSSAGKGDYCLYHGNMAVSENIEAVIWLIQNIFSKINVPFVIAGNKIPQKILTYTKQYSTIRCIPDPSIDAINELVKNAQVNVLPSMNATGVKLKLLNALLNGRFCITNYQGAAGSGLHQFVTEADSADEWINLIEDVMQKEFTVRDVAVRQEVLHIYNNKANAQKLSALW